MGTSSGILQKVLGVRVPIIQAPMAGVSTPALAAAVSEAGGLGSISLGASDHSGARAILSETRSLTEAPINVNVFCHRPAIAQPDLDQAWIERLRPAFEALGASPPQRLTEIYRSFVEDELMLHLVLEFRPSVLSFHFGLPPADTIRKLKAANIVLLATVTNVSEASVAVDAGVDVLVAQGWEAGGHRGVFDPKTPDERLETRQLVELLAGHSSVPVVAAGGIMTGMDIAEVIKLGAAGAQLGTAFIAATESAADSAYREAVRQACLPTVMTDAITGRQARGLPTALTALLSTARPEDIPAYPRPYGLAKALIREAQNCGRHDYAVRWAGENVAQSRPMPAARLVAVLEEELLEAF